MEALSQLEHLATLNLRGCELEGLPPLASNRQLMEVHLVYARGIRSLDGLQGCENLHEVDITYTEISDISALDKTTSLRLFSAARTGIEDISALRWAPLQELWIGGTEVKDLSPLYGMYTLRNMSLYNTAIARSWFQDGDIDAKAQYDKLIETLPDCEIEWGIADMS